MPETRYEVIDGEVVYVSPAEYPHASRHSKLSALLEAYVADGFDAVCDMLTRTSEKGDMAPDGSIFPLEPDPETEGRQIERLAFEVVNTNVCSGPRSAGVGCVGPVAHPNIGPEDPAEVGEARAIRSRRMRFAPSVAHETHSDVSLERLSHAGRKAAALKERGVERVFAIDVERQRLLEWSTETDAWSMLLTSDVIEDRSLVAPMPIAALVGAASEDDAIAQALIAKKNPVLLGAVEARFDEGRDAGRDEGLAVGRVEGKAEALRAVLSTRGLVLSAEQRALLESCSDNAVLERWLIRAVTAANANEVFDG